MVFAVLAVPELRDLSDDTGTGLAVQLSAPAEVQRVNNEAHDTVRARLLPVQLITDIHGSRIEDNRRPRGMALDVQMMVCVEFSE